MKRDNSAERIYIAPNISDIAVAIESGFALSSESPLPGYGDAGEAGDDFGTGDYGDF